MATRPPPKYDPPFRLNAFSPSPSYSALNELPPSKEFGDVPLNSPTRDTSYGGPYLPTSGTAESGFTPTTPTASRSYTSISGRVLPQRIAPQKFKKSKPILILDVINESIVALLMVPFIVLAFYATKLDGQRESAWGEKVRAVTNFGPTFFSIFFAGVIGHALWNISSWKLEQGATIGLLESLMGSRTIMSTAITLVMLRRLSIISILLVVLWAISPLGGQASLRLVETRHVFVGKPVQLTYVNTFDTEPADFSGFMGANTAGETLSRTETLYNAAFVANASSDRDPWGNPRLLRSWKREEQAGATSNVSDWISLVGVPIANIPSKGNTSFTIKAGYIKLDLHDVVSGEIALNESCPSGSGKHFAFNMTNPNENTHKQNSMQLIIGGLPVDTGVTINLTATAARAEFDIYCESAASCKTIAQRPIDEGKRTSQLFATTGLNLLQNFPCSDGNVRPIFFTKFESYLISGLPFTSVTMQADSKYKMSREYTIELLKKVDHETLRRRIETLLNSYYMASYWESIGFAYSFPPSTEAEDDNGTPWKAKMSTKGETGHMEVRYKVIRVWVAVLILSSLVPMAVSIYGSTLKFKTCRVDVLGFVSALTRDNPYVDSGEGPAVNSTLGGLSRSRAMQDRVICFGDIGDPNDPHGHLAVCDVKLRTAKISKKKSYIGLGQ